ncbi:flagellar motor switch protein FliN [Rickettsiaceae bacterium]|nr:flagellar motor switch protein FliN [Rickettsiaceae bacterium]
MTKKDIDTDKNKDGKDSELTLEALYDVPVKVSVVLGNTTMSLSNILKLGKGAVIELERTVGDPIDVYVNNKKVAKGEIVIVDEKIGVTLTEVVIHDKNPEQLEQILEKA